MRISSHFNLVAHLKMLPPHLEISPADLKIVHVTLTISQKNVYLRNTEMVGTGPAGVGAL